VGKDIRRIRIAMIGMGAANVSTYRLLKVFGVDLGGIVACDSKATLHKGRRDLEAQQETFPDKWRVCQETNAQSVTGGVADAMRGADVLIAFSAPNIVRPEWVKAMARDAVVFACANPIPEIWPWEAKEAGAKIIATGRSDFSNQVNNSLVFPAVFRGTLDVRARTITDEMALTAAQELARCAEERGIHEENILPKMEEWNVVPRVAVATAMKAQEQGVAKLTKAPESLLEEAVRRIKEAREATQRLMEAGIISAAPEVL